MADKDTVTTAMSTATAVLGTGPAPVLDRRAQTRSAAIMAAVRQQISERATLLDRAEDLGEVTITVKLQAGTVWIRGVEWREERLWRQRR